MKAPCTEYVEHNKSAIGSQLLSVILGFTYTTIIIIIQRIKHIAIIATYKGNFFFISSMVVCIMLT